MEKINLPPFYSGQVVECVSGTGVLKIGARYKITGVFKDCCGYSVTVGIPVDSFELECSKCKKIVPEPTGEWKFNPENFRAIQEQSYPLMTFSKIQELEKEEILINN